MLILAVRITLPGGDVTVFSYATTATVKGGVLGVFAWNQERNELDEVATFRVDQFVRAEVMLGESVASVIDGAAETLPAVSESRSS